ncbi:hypothetical protein [Treponema sp.]|uniref:hypothetical protein n=1 Tax=Treponema sp. TaxID=166 RepID=UPI002A812C53|nr:hypothetical protein [Treponema sp.]MCI6441745.1 hypothetical protein [Spirochaetia bacterium]MDY4133213.1 hypothetical protein [Treponema sp.]
MAEEFEARENPVYGRKVFFINASFTIEQLAKGMLRDMEYETYIIEDLKQAKCILRKNPDSICLVNLDQVGANSLTVVQYLNFILSCEGDETLSSIFFGVLSINTSPKQMNLFFYNVKLPCGYVPASPNREDFAETLKCILDVNGAKGRRQYVRATCEVSGNAFISIPTKNGDVNLPLVDFSSVGLACKIPEKMCGVIAPNTSFPKVDLWLYGVKFPAPLVVLKEFKKGDMNVLVTLFAKNITMEVRKKVRSYVFRILEGNIDTQADYSNPDETVYPLELSKKNMVVNMDDLPSAEDLGEAQELEEL